MSITGPLKTTTSHLHVHAVHHDVAFSRAMTATDDAELHALSKWLGLDHVSSACPEQCFGVGEGDGHFGAEGVGDAVEGGQAGGDATAF